MTRHVIRFITDPTRPDDGPLLASYDPDGNAGRGTITVTHDPATALSWEDAAGALACYAQTSTVLPVRPDGRPNKPLTAYTVALETIEETTP